MAETALTVTTEPAQYAQAGVAVTMTAVDNANGNKWPASRDQLAIVQNTDSGSHTVTITSQPLAGTGRLGDDSHSLAAGEIRIFHLTTDGWADVNGNVLMPSGQDTHLKVGIVNLQ